ncbi:MAG TPA: flagellar export chaperone FliS [Bryobacteraceae bacterium]|jgi:flagellar protein FliS|nr:flagellar export chaperone FliS [Bryobacteraceae bacterium]
MALPNPHQEYVKQRVQSASPVELIRILYEAAVQQVDEAVQALHSGDILKRGHAVTKTVEILSELRIALRYDVQQEYCSTLAGLYSYMQGQLIRAHSEQSETLLLEVSRLLHTLLEGWNGAIENLNNAAEKKNQEVEIRVAAAAAPGGRNRYSAEPESSPLLVRSWQV